MKTIASTGRSGFCRAAQAARSRRAYLAAFVSVVAAFAASPAKAEGWADRLYLKVFGGLHGLADGDITQGGISGEGSYGSGSIFGAGLGKEFTQNWALEAEFFYRSNDLDSVSAGGLAGSTEGDFASTNLMLNGVYTFTRDDGSGRWGKFTPFVGAGLGVLQEADVDAKVGGLEREYDDNWIFAAQVFAGVTYEVNATWSVFWETRYHHAGEIELKSSGAVAPVKADYNGLSGLVGVRYTF